MRDLLACARAVADTSDELSLVTALRSPLFGCGDDDLWRWKHAGGKFRVGATLEWTTAPGVADGPVAAALEWLGGLRRRARWATPSEVLGTIVAERRMLEVAASGPRSRDVWRRLRFVVDQARAWGEVSHGGLRAYLAWAAHQGTETTRVAESVLPETDVDAVRVMTVHAAKGLEFPMVVLSGMTSQSRRRAGVKLLWPDGGGYSMWSSPSTSRWTSWRSGGCCTSRRRGRATTWWCRCTVRAARTRRRSGSPRWGRPVSWGRSSSLRGPTARRRVAWALAATGGPGERRTTSCPPGNTTNGWRA